MDLLWHLSTITQLQWLGYFSDKKTCGLKHVLFIVISVVLVFSDCFVILLTIVFKNYLFYFSYVLWLTALIFDDILLPILKSEIFSIILFPMLKSKIFSIYIPLW